jgi:hypothetical protein
MDCTQRRCMKRSTRVAPGCPDDKARADTSTKNGDQPSSSRLARTTRTQEILAFEPSDKQSVPQRAQEVTRSKTSVEASIVASSTVSTATSFGPRTTTDRMGCLLLDLVTCFRTFTRSTDFSDLPSHYPRCLRTIELNRSSEKRGRLMPPEPLESPKILPKMHLLTERVIELPLSTESLS